jgi:hypothetical protein
MNRQRRLHLMAVAERAAEVNRLVAEYERELLRDRDGRADEAEAPPSCRRRRRCRITHP